MKTKKKPIIQPYGNVGVDSGQLLIIDPCYLEQFMRLYSYDDICNIEGEMKYEKGHGGIACKLGGFGGYYMSEEENEEIFGEDQSTNIKIIFDDGHWITASQDDEGNGSGVIFTSYSKLSVIPSI